MNVNIKRLIGDINELGSIGWTDGAGANRMAYSKAFFEGRDFVQRRMEEAGLVTSIDAVGNLTGYLPGNGEGALKKRIAIGSHIDTVPNGGIYDGALGVLAAIESVLTMKENGYRNFHPVEIIAFNEEEGNVVGGTFGSKAFAGADTEASMRVLMKKQHITAEDFESCRRSPENYLAYLEYHIEQGGILENRGKTIGIVESICGILRYKAKVCGKANHAGSTPMALRDDAMEKSCRIIAELMEKVRNANDTMVCTVGAMTVKPGAVNVIPGETEFIIELRDKNMTEMYGIIEELRKKWEMQGLVLEEYITQPETLCDCGLQQIVQQAADRLGYSSMKMVSGAGHDLINMAFMMPGMLIFIPSHDGISHHRNEYSSPEDIQAGAQVLLESIIKIDRGEFADEN